MELALGILQHCDERELEQLLGWIDEAHVWWVRTTIRFLLIVGILLPAVVFAGPVAMAMLLRVVAGVQTDGRLLGERGARVL